MNEMTRYRRTHAPLVCLIIDFVRKVYSSFLGDKRIRFVIRTCMCMSYYLLFIIYLLFIPYGHVFFKWAFCDFGKSKTKHKKVNNLASNANF